jgi:DNA-directed RNA polymerase specialized sigma24 family protein
MSDVTRILARIESGDAYAAEQLMPLVYDELRKLATAKLAQERPGQTLQATALVHEAFLRLAGRHRAGDSEPTAETDGGNPSLAAADPRAAVFDSRGHFFAAAAVAMRRILVENARRRGRLKQGGGWQREEGAFEAVGQITSPEEILDVDQALQKLTLENPSIARLVELRYFAGLTIDEAAAALSISSRTAQRHWVYAKAWLMEELRGYGRDG